MHKCNLLLVIVLSTSFSVFSQGDFGLNTGGGNTFANDINGRPMYLKTEYVASGSPYLYDEYCMAQVTTMNGKVYNNVKAKINLQEKLLLFTADNGEEMIMTTPIKKIKFYNYVSNGVAYPERTFQSHLAPLNTNDAAIYEVLADDSAATLLKLTTITFNDSKGYGEATVTRTFKRKDAWFAAIPFQSKELQKVEKNKTAIAGLFGNKSAAVAGYITEKKLKCRSDEDLVDIFRYYSSL